MALSPEEPQLHLCLVKFLLQQRAAAPQQHAAVSDVIQQEVGVTAAPQQHAAVSDVIQQEVGGTAAPQQRKDGEGQVVVVFDGMSKWIVDSFGETSI